MYERNPYLNTYRIVLRFMGMESLEYDHPFSNKGIGLERDNESRLRLIDEGCLKRTIIESNSVASISIAPLINDERFSIINVKGKKVFVSYIPPIAKSNCDMVTKDFHALFE